MSVLPIHRARIAKSWRAVVLLLSLLPAAPACNRTESSSAKPVDPPANHLPAGRSPLQVVKDAHAHRLAGRLDLLSECLVSEQSASVVELVRSVDELIAADEALHAALAEGYGTGVAGTFQRPGLANIIGVFSRDVEIVSEQVRGGRVDVAVQIAGRIPLDYVELVRHDGRWLMRTDPPIPGLAEELSDLARVLSSLSREIFHHRYTLQRFEEEYRLRTSGVLRRIKALLSEAPPPP